MLHPKVFRAFAMAVACALSMTAHALADTPETVNVAAGNLVDALEILAKQRGVDVIYPSSQLRGLTTEGVSGLLETRAAFQELLKGTRLVVKEEGGSILILGASTSSVEGVIRLAQSENPQNADSSSSEKGQGSKESSSETSPEVSQNQAPQEIIVTAQRRAEVVTNVPISIAVVNQRELERQQINNIEDLNRIAPSLEIQSGQGLNTGGGGSIRGIGTVTFSAGAVASVGVVVDQVSQGNANLSELFDVSRVEVLKGPQGTLFGLSTSAGVINITTNAPDPSAFSGRVRTELSDADSLGSKYGQQVVQGVVNLPVNEDSALRLSGSVNLRQGPGFNTDHDGYTNIDHSSIRGRYLWQPTDALTINVIGDYSYRDENGLGDFITIARADARHTELLASCGVTVEEGNRKFCTSSDLYGSTRIYGGSLQIDYDLGPAILTSISSYRDSLYKISSLEILRYDTADLSVFSGPQHLPISLFTQEFRVSSQTENRLEFTAGAFYSRQRTNQAPYAFSVFLQVAPGVEIPLSLDAGARNDVLDESMAAFGQVTFHATDKLSLIAGGRFTQESLSLDRLDFNLTPAAPSDLKLDTDKISYRFGAQYNLERDTIVYAVASRGYKGGQIATRSFPLPAYILRPEIPQNYELGFKTMLPGGLVADLNVFHTRFRDFQAQSCQVDSATQFLECFPSNISAVTSKGAEINFFGRVFESFNVNTGLIYVDAVYPNGFTGINDVDPDPNIVVPADLSGEQIAFAPRWKFTFSGEYERPLTNNFNGFVGIDTVWKSRIRYEQSSLPSSTFREHWIVGCRIGVRSADDRYEATFFARNLFDVNEPLIFTSDSPAAGPENTSVVYSPNAFRLVGVSLSARF